MRETQDTSTDWGAQVLGAVTEAASGAAAGAILGPPGMIVGGLVGLARSFTNQPHEEREAPALQTVAQAITGVADAAEQVAVLQADPVKGEAFRIKALEVRAATQEAERAHVLAMFKAAADDRENARKTQAALAASGSALAWATPIISGVVLLSFLGIIVLIAVRGIPQGSETILNILVGTLVAMATSVVSYYVGSSQGSANKERMLAARRNGDE